MLQNPQLGAPAFECIYITVRYEWPVGWYVGITGRRSGSEEWQRETYDACATVEVADLVGISLDTLLGT